MTRAIRWLAALPALLLPALLLAVVVTPAAFAHALPGTAALLDFRRHDVGLELDMPLDQFELGFKHPVMDAPLRTAARYPRELRDYLVEHVRPVAPDGRPWDVRVDGLRVDPATDASPTDLVAHLTLTPPPGASARRFRLNYSVINHEVMTHAVLVFARSDWQNGVFGQSPELLGTVRWLTTGIDVDRAQGSFWSGFLGVVALGMRHIAEGTDHLLFLLALLLPAPLVREDGRRRGGQRWSGQRWGGYGGARHALLELARLVTAFTLGHSATLVVGAFTDVAIPTTPVEVLIALSIFVSALHAWRPLLRGREAWVAAGFGLVHGLSFSQVVSSAGLDGWHKAAAVFGFNIGIELVQIAVVLAVVPWLILLARSRRYTPVRVGGAAFAALASLAWAAERVTGVANPVSRLLEGLTAAAPWLLAALALWAMAAAATSRREMPAAA